MEEFDKIALERKNYAATPQQRRFYRDQYKVVQPNQGGGRTTVKTKEHPEHKQLVLWKRENLTSHVQESDAEQWSSRSSCSWSLSAWSSWWNCSQGHGHHDPPHLTLQHTSWATQHMVQKSNTRRLGAVRPISESSIFHPKKNFESPVEEWHFERRCVHRYPLPRALFQRFGFQTHLDALRTLSALLWFKVGLSKSFPQVILADLLHPSANIHDLDIFWPNCSHSFACWLPGGFKCTWSWGGRRALYLWRHPDGCLYFCSKISETTFFGFVLVMTHTLSHKLANVHYHSP